MTNESLRESLKSEGFTSEGDGEVTLAGCTLSFQVNGKSVLFVANKPARAELLLAPESEYTHSADKLGVSQESKIGESDFDDRYVIRDPEGQAGSVLTTEVIAAVEALEPFVELQLSKKQYRLLKEGLDESEAVKAIRKLEELVGLTCS
jgi:hypothetical protein